MSMDFTRGDTHKIKFRLEDLNGQELILEPEDKLYFTVKKDYSKDAVVSIQKTLNNGIEYLSGYYYITLESIDTSNLEFGSYVFDIELKSGTFVRTLVKGDIKLLYEVTTSKDENITETSEV